METRRPIVAGQFYPGRKDLCIDEIKECLEAAPVTHELPETIAAGIVPHAGWTFSGAVAAMVFAAVKERHEQVDTFVIFGAAHGYYGSMPALYDRGAWATQLGDAAIDAELAAAVIESGTAVSDPAAHAGEHSMEVQVPFIQYLFPSARILPVLSPPGEQTIKAGEIVGSIIAGDDERKIVCIGSTDLTHYGPRYGFTPMGTGKKALRWAMEVNDRKFIDYALKMQPEKMLETAAANLNACGPGAAAAAVAAAKALGKTEGILLAHTNSNEVLRKKMATESPEAVGYAAIVF